jgi:TatD DNase family protein
MISTAGLVDFHCHLDLYPDFPAAVQEAEQAGVFTLAVTTTPRAWPRNQELAQHTKYVRAALGLHPQLVADHEHELHLWDRYLPEARYIGEVGLDAGPRYYSSLEAQNRVFRHVLKSCAEIGGKILTVHSVRSVKQVLDNLDAYFPPDKGKVVLHWFTGSKSECRRAIEMGCYFSVNATMLGSSKHASMVEAIPLERILTETDGPFTQAGERKSKPSDVVLAVEMLGVMHGTHTDEMARIIRENLRGLVIASVN